MQRKRLGTLGIPAFMERHWQRSPKLFRGAFPAFRDPLTPAEVLRLAGYEEAVSRLVRRRAGRWSLEHGPFPASRWKRLPPRDWTVLVQDTQHFSREAEALLSRFDFIPHARIDDVMVSYAVPGGGVGPHVDSYDVFLLQGHGRRRWQVSRQREHAHVPGLPLAVLANFVPEREWVLESGDMLYLPPGVAHNGVAETECLTWSIGFRAPTDAELVQAFLDFLRDRIGPEGQYGDAGARAARHPGALPEAMVEHVGRVMQRVRWDALQVREFAGRHLSEPKAHVFFDPPRPALSRARFAAIASRRGMRLDPRSRLLFSGTMFFMNGETVRVEPEARGPVRRLADRRRLEPARSWPESFVALAHEWYRRGYLVPGGET